jgi:hypothetical protein
MIMLRAVRIAPYRDSAQVFGYVLAAQRFRVLEAPQVPRPARSPSPVEAGYLPHPQ